MAEGDRERWDRRWADGEHAAPELPRWLDALEPGLIPARGRALDVAAGSGRVALWLASRGFDTLALDISPVALEQCARAARADGLKLQTLACDLEAEPLPAGPWDVITCFHYLQRDLFPQLAAALAPSGALVCEIATVENLERHARPSERFLLRTGELAELCAPLRLGHSFEGWVEGRALARVVAGKE